MTLRIMEKIRNLPEGQLEGTCETDECYVKAGSKGVSLKDNGGGPDRSQPPRTTPPVRPQHLREGQADVHHMPSAGHHG